MHFQNPHMVPAQAFASYPLNWDLIFQRKAPLAVEIGFGNGEFLVNWAKQHPDWNFVGIDYSIASTERLQKRLLQNSIDNVRIIHDDALFALRELFPDNCIQEIIMNFPDPWPKKRHKERRMMQLSFIETLGAVLRIEGAFELITDQLWFVKDAHFVFSESHYFEVKEIEKNPQRFLTTKYEKKWRNSGCHIYRLISTKKISSIISRILESSAMPHKIIERDISPDQIIKLKNFEDRQSCRLFVVKEVFNDFGNNSYLLRVVTKDYDYSQDFYIVVKKHKNNWLVKLDDICSVYRTPAVKMAVNRIGEVLSS